MHYYDKDYFEAGNKGYNGYWENDSFNEFAEMIIDRFKPESVLDLGCAKGYLVKALHQKGVKAFGKDISEYATSFYDGLICGDITDLSDCPDVDLIVSFDTFEHLPEKDLKKLREQMRKKGKRFYFRIGTVNTPDWEHDKSHITIKPPEFWQDWMPEAVIEESL